MADAYNAALASGTGFKMFISFDMTAISCSSPQDADNIANVIVKFSEHAAQLKDTLGAAYVSTYSGEHCTWGIGFTPGWTQAAKTGPARQGVETKFIPSFFIDHKYAGQYTGFMDGTFPVSGRYQSP